MKKIFIFAIMIVFIFSITTSTSNAAVESNKYLTKSVSNEDITVNSYIITKFGSDGNIFSVGDKLSLYSVILNINLVEINLFSPVKWKDPEYLIKDGYQEVVLVIDVPAHAEITVGITGEFPPTDIEPEATPTSEATNSTLPNSEEKVVNPSLVKTALNIKPKAKYKLAIENLPKGYTVSYISSNKKVATVGLKGGVITGKVKGKTVITCTITTPSGEKIKLKCSVVVK
jgi:hypothetical protein